MNKIIDKFGNPYILPIEEVEEKPLDKVGRVVEALNGRKFIIPYEASNLVVFEPGAEIETPIGKLVCHKLTGRPEYLIPPIPHGLYEYEYNISGIDNTITATTGRTPICKHDTPESEMEEYEKLAKIMLGISKQKFISRIRIHGTLVEVKTNSPHIKKFVELNYFGEDDPTQLKLAERLKQDMISAYVINHVPGVQPSAYYNENMNMILIFNTSYYGQLKSWVLGAIAKKMERIGVHSLHAACVGIPEYGGVIIIAPTGTGKSTNSYGLTGKEFGGKMQSDDWIYVDNGYAYVSEKRWYFRTDLTRTFPELENGFWGLVLENVFNNPYTNTPDLGVFPNSRAIFDPDVLPIPSTNEPVKPRLVILLKREYSDGKVARRLTENEFIEYLEEGLTPEGKREPFYNAYLHFSEDETKRAKEMKQHSELFRKLYGSVQKDGACIIINTIVPPKKILQVIEYAIKNPNEELNIRRGNIDKYIK